MSNYLQAPLPETITQFWTMVWEKDIGVIVALNQVGIGDSPRYWPEKNGATVDYQPIRVEKIKTEKMPLIRGAIWAILLPPFALSFFFHLPFISMQFFV